jgi:hypothetical protein
MLRRSASVSSSEAATMRSRSTVVARTVTPVRSYTDPRRAGVSVRSDVWRRAWAASSAPRAICQ